MSQLTTQAGIATFEDGESMTDFPLFTGERPVHTDTGTVAADQDISALAVLAKNADGDLVPAVSDAGDTTETPVCIAMTAAETGSDETTDIPVYWSGCFNPDRLVWDSSWDTEEKRMSAFGDPSKSNIALKKMR